VNRRLFFVISAVINKINEESDDIEIDIDRRNDDAFYETRIDDRHYVVRSNLVRDLELEEYVEIIEEDTGDAFLNSDAYVSIFDKGNKQAKIKKELIVSEEFNLIIDNYLDYCLYFGHIQVAKILLFLYDYKFTRDSYKFALLGNTKINVQNSFLSGIIHRECVIMLGSKEISLVNEISKKTIYSILFDIFRDTETFQSIEMLTDWKIPRDSFNKSNNFFISEFRSLFSVSIYEIYDVDIFKYICRLRALELDFSKTSSSIEVWIKIIKHEKEDMMRYIEHFYEHRGCESRLKNDSFSNLC